MGTAELAVMLGARRPLLPPPRAGPVGVTLSAATRNAVPLCSPRKTGPRVEGPGGRDCDGNEKVCLMATRKCALSILTLSYTQAGPLEQRISC